MLLVTTVRHYPVWQASIGAGVLWALVTLTAYIRQRDPARPPLPHHQIAPIAQLRPEPERRVPVLGHNCEICGRPLTNMQSMIARVGSTCIQTYGPRYAWQPNPDHERWTRELARARAAQAAEQARLDVLFASAMLHHDRAIREWQDEFTSDEGLARRARRKRAGWVLASAVVWCSLVVALQPSVFGS